MEIKETNIWNHFPYISSRPVDILENYVNINKDSIDEIALVLMENEEYLVIHYCGNLKDKNMGFTELREFEDNLEEACKFYAEKRSLWE